MPSRFHDGARRSRLPDREAARRWRGLDGRHRRRDQDCGGTPLVFMRLVAALIADSARQQLQCVGCDKNYLWYSVGLLLVSLVRVGVRWPCWYSPKLIKTVKCVLPCLMRCAASNSPL